MTRAILPGSQVKIGGLMVSTTASTISGWWCGRTGIAESTAVIAG